MSDPELRIVKGIAGYRDVAALVVALAVVRGRRGEPSAPANPPSRWRQALTERPPSARRGWAR